MANTIKLRRGTAAQWASANSVLADGEPGFEIDTNKFKIGTGTASWNDLPYLTIDPATASSLYATISDVESNYLPISASSNYLFIDTASATYLRQDTASVQYLTKADAAGTYFPISSSGSLLTESEASSIYAPLSSPSLTGIPLAPTAASGTNTTQIATTAFVRTEVSALVDAAPSTLDTLNELAAALNDDPNFATTVTNSIATKLDSATASTLYLPISGSVNWSNINDKPDPVITLGGDLSGSVTLTDLTSATLNATIAANSVNLGTDTTGNYVAGLTAGNGISISGTAEEGWSPTVSINSSTASVTFANITSKPTTLSGYGITDALTTSASSNFALLTISINPQTSASYGLVASDAGKLIEMNNAGANTVVIPLNSSVPFSIGTKIDIIQTGEGQTSASFVSGVTLNSDGNKRTINSQWAAASLIKRGTDTWVLIGALKS